MAAQCDLHFRAAQLVEREQRTLSKFDASVAAQQAQIARLTDLQSQLVRDGSG